MVVVLYGLALFALSIASINYALLTVVFLRRRRPPSSLLPTGPEPLVTIQLPLFNEFYVAERVIRSACEVDYPLHRLEIQVLDDSTDETLELTRRLVRDFQSRGIPIVHIHREKRTGFKSGALAEGFRQARGEFIAVFDADFVVPRDFLRQTLPHFAESSIGIVQTRWGYLNENANELTRANALAMDGHFVVEQSARCLAGLFANFNGTAGVLRARAIAEAGGWQDDTLAEDIDLSYRAQLAGWRVVYLRDVVCFSEIPSDIHSIKAQQFRWTKGNLEAARKILPRLWASDLPISIKYQGAVHLLNGLAYPLSIALAALSPFMVMATGPRHLKLTGPIMAYYQVASVGTFFYFYTSARALGGHWKQRLGRYPILLMVFIGLSVNNTHAILEALVGKRSPFERTPKYNVLTGPGDAGRSRYLSRATQSLAWELALAGCCAVALVLAVILKEFAALPFLLVWTGGYTMVSYYSIRHEHLALPKIRALGSSPAPVVVAAISEQGSAA
jgi:cellulose synthase/poly-beta-1,6-N-acetylglucosamine synthase-like glycosyltransferase